MSGWVVEVGADATSVRCDGWDVVAPLGATNLSDELRGDPPRPEELTNAIGAVVDHLEDVVRDRPDVIGAAVCVSGPEVRALADVEVGRRAVLPLTLGRDAIEEVFRTLATEPARDRRHNPGLPAEMVHTALGASCIVVALMRRLQLDAVTIVDDADERLVRSGS